MKPKAAIFKSVKRPLVVDEVEVADPEAGEVLIEKLPGKTGGLFRIAVSALALPLLLASSSHGQTANTAVEPKPAPVIPEGVSPAAQPESKLGLAVMRLGDDRKPQQPYRVKVGDKTYDFAHLLKLRPADTKNARVEILTDFSFQHGSLLSDLKELSFIKQKIQAGQQPWAGEFEKMKKSRYAHREYLARMKVPPVVISSDFSGANNRGAIEEMRDANAAYTQALMWYFTGDRAYAENAAGILETYAKTVTSHEGKNWYLEVAWAGSVFPLSAALLKATYPEWRNHRMVARWFNDVFLPVLYDRMSFGNREFAVIAGLAAIGIFNEDRAAFYLALNHWMNYISAYHYLAEDGPSPYLADYWTPEITPSREFLLSLNEPTFPKDWTPWITLSEQKWSREKIRGKFGDDSTSLSKNVAARIANWVGAPVTYVNGYCAETARDFGHVEESLAAEINVAEMAWHQGIDIYTPHARRLTTFMETHAALRLGETPPDSMTAPLVPYALVSTFEIAYNHYAHRMGVALPNTWKIIQILRLTSHDGISPVAAGEAGRDPQNPRLWKYPPPLPSLFASKVGGSVGWLSSWEALTHGDLDKR